ncbi:MAG: hypothetical protein R3C04_03125 [Hyphomonas sp.]
MRPACARDWGSDYRAADVFLTDINMDVMGGVDAGRAVGFGQKWRAG